jgi:hypothetical protein
MTNDIVHAVKTARIVDLKEAREAYNDVRKAIDAYVKELELLNTKLEILSVFIKIHEKHEQGNKPENDSENRDGIPS